MDVALAAARTAQPAWAARPYAERAAILRRAAELIREHVDRLGAVVALEVGKNRVEAVGEVEEAADLLDEYCRQIEDADGFVVPLRDGPGGERNRSVLRPFGVFGVIAPFNFPVALSAGPIAGALVAGNTVVFKPADLDLVVGGAARAAAAPGRRARGRPRPRPGRAGRPALAQHDGLDGIVFTGSYEVGRERSRATSPPRYPPAVHHGDGRQEPGDRHGQRRPRPRPPRASRARPSAPAVRSARPARACCRGAVADELLELLAAEAARWRVAEPGGRRLHARPGARRGRLRALPRGRAEAGARRARGRRRRRRARRAALPRGCYVEPTVVAGLPDDHRLLTDELFVPLVAVQEVASLDEALERANATQYGLTAGVFTEDQDEWSTFLDRIEAGVVYVNRAAGATTGAWPGVQSFRGWKGSGSTGKGGLGPYYVLQFLREQSRTIVS